MTLHIKRIPRLVLVALLVAVFSVLSNRPAQAISGSLVYFPTNNKDAGNCAGSEIGYTVSYTGQTADAPSPLDWGIVIATDGNGKLLGGNGFGIAPGYNHVLPLGITLDGITAGPVTISFVDVTTPFPTAADAIGKPVIASFTVDPAKLFPSCAVPPCAFMDGRINANCFGTDAGQPDAIYCSNGGVEIYAIYKSVGYFAFRVTKTELAALPEHPASNLLIKQGSGAKLYRLTSGELQLNGPNGYVYQWGGC